MGLARLLLPLLLTVCPLAAQRVLLISLDGFGYQRLEHEATRGMTNLRSVLARGTARPMQPAFPSTTANGHIALATGAWGDTNGKHANSHPIAPRAQHSSFERTNGFRAEGLAAEPLWVAVARQGVKSAAVNFVPTYPFLPSIAPAGAPLTVINHYQTRRLAPNRMLTAKDMIPIPCEGWEPELEPSRKPRRCFFWQDGDLAFHGSLGASKPDAYDHFDAAVELSTPRVRAWAAPLESAPPANRPLARHFSPGLPLGEPPVAVVYFRLFDVSADGTSFTLLRSAAEELGVFDAAAPAMRTRILREAGGVIGNGSTLGSPLDDTALRRTLELDELAIRQQSRLQEWVWRNAQPRLHMGYFSYPDHSDHAWLALASTNPRIAAARAWIYQALDAALKPLIDSSGPADSIVFVSDHGMGEVRKDISYYLPLERAGLVARSANGRLDESRSKLSGIYNCFVVNTRDWRGGIVPTGERATILATLRRVLGDLRDPDTRQPVFTAFYSTDADKTRFGFGGQAGADLCADPAPGYYLNATFNGPVIETRAQPTGQHGGFPLRDDMRSLFLAAGPRLQLPAHAAPLRAIDVAPLLTDLLNIAPPAQASGRSPLQSQ
ncbi:MAG: alkaline phosphatase family protein [Bryobacterales bacterium]|nr:alkaline phosphatase family protein [Bryobacterales bacterium]